MKRYAYRILRVYNNLDAYQRFLDEANELGYNIISVATLSDYTLLVTYEATHLKFNEETRRYVSNTSGD